MDHINEHKVRSQSNVLKPKNMASTQDVNPYWPKARVVNKAHLVAHETAKNHSSKP